MNMFEKLDRWVARVVFCTALCIGAAHADEIRLDATRGAPIVEVEINGQKVRLIVDTRMPALAAINPDAATRLRLRRLPGFVAAEMELDGERVLRGRVARPDVRFANGRSERILTALFAATGVEGADGLIGPGALAYDSVRIVLEQAARGGNAHVIALETASQWSWRRTVEGEAARVAFDVGRDETLVARRLTRNLVSKAVFTPSGAVARVPFRLGIQMNGQAMIPRHGLAVEGRLLGPTIGHTDDALIAPEGMEEAIIVTAAGRSAPPFLFLGRSALRSCSEIVATRAERQLVLYCD